MHVNNELQHHGVLGQKWGVRRFQNADGSLTPRGAKRYNRGIKKVEKKFDKAEAARNEAESYVKKSKKISGKENVRKRLDLTVKAYQLDDAGYSHLKKGFELTNKLCSKLDNGEEIFRRLSPDVVARGQSLIESYRIGEKKYRGPNLQHFPESVEVRANAAKQSKSYQNKMKKAEQNLAKAEELRAEAHALLEKNKERVSFEDMIGALDKDDPDVWERANRQAQAFELDEKASEYWQRYASSVNDLASEYGADVVRKASPEVITRGDTVVDEFKKDEEKHYVLSI